MQGNKIQHKKYKRITMPVDTLKNSVNDIQQELDKKIFDLGEEIKKDIDVKNQVLESKIDILTKDINTVNQNINNLQEDIGNLQELLKILVANQLLDKI